MKVILIIISTVLHFSIIIYLYSLLKNIKNNKKIM